MPLRVSNSVEKDIVSVPRGPIVVKDTVSVIVLANNVADGNEYSGLYIQNVGANDCYYCFGGLATPTNFNGILSKAGTVNVDGYGSGQQLDCSNFGGQVSVFSRGGTTIAVTVLKRDDLSQGKGGIKFPDNLQSL